MPFPIQYYLFACNPSTPHPSARARQRREALIGLRRKTASVCHLSRLRARARFGSDSPPGCHSIPNRRSSSVPRGKVNGCQTSLETHVFQLKSIKIHKESTTLARVCAEPNLPPWGKGDYFGILFADEGGNGVSRDAEMVDEG